ncbi:hypothetical protein PR048_031008 [Dryococelus australis]|uniref:Uncharacterized protein n=1 Tax=Dryococelus australis TaxID=614101 RepID=A0ABQ9G4V8_9NEOP|nr:hypothetical protein PR048_031008 [Dryococelus australis]
MKVVACRSQSQHSFQTPSQNQHEASRSDNRTINTGLLCSQLHFTKPPGSAICSAGALSWSAWLVGHAFVLALWLSLLCGPYLELQPHAASNINQLVTRAYLTRWQTEGDDVSHNEQQTRWYSVQTARRPPRRTGLNLQTDRYGGVHSLHHITCSLNLQTDRYEGVHSLHHIICGLNLQTDRYGGVHSLHHIICSLNLQTDRYGGVHSLHHIICSLNLQTDRYGGVHSLHHIICSLNLQTDRYGGVHSLHHIICSLNLQTDRYGGVHSLHHIICSLNLQTDRYGGVHSLHHIICSLNLQTDRYDDYMSTKCIIEILSDSDLEYDLRIFACGIAPANAAGQRVFSGFSRFYHPFIPALLRSLKRLEFTQQRSSEKCVRFVDLSIRRTFNTLVGKRVFQKNLQPILGELEHKSFREKQAALLIRNQMAELSPQLIHEEVNSASIEPRLCTVPMIKFIHLQRESSGGAVVSLLASHHGDPGSIPAGSLPDHRMWESCWTMKRRSILGPHFMSCPGMTGIYGSQLETPTMTLVGGFSRISPVSPVLSYSPRFTLIGSRDLDVRSR